MKPWTGKQLAYGTALAIAAGLVPMVLYWMSFGRGPSLNVEEAKALLNRADSTAVLVDVRPGSAYTSNQVTGAVSWPIQQIAACTNANDIPPALRNKKLLLLSEAGWSSAGLVRRLNARIGLEFCNVSGGRVAWLAHGDGKTSKLPFRAMSLFEQWLVVIVAFGVKPIYMSLSLLLIIWLWRQPAVDLAALRWGLIWFGLGESACAIGYLFFERASDLWEFLHAHGMVVGFSFMSFALLQGLDLRLIKFSPQKERCAALNLCRACIKYGDAPCGLKRLFTVMIPAFMLLAVMPLCAEFNLTSYDAKILDSIYNYYHLPSAQWFELRYCAGLALLLFAASWLVLIFKRENAVEISKVLFAAAAGALGFGMLRMFLAGAFGNDLMWFDVWEEVTELLAMLSIGVVLWVFRYRLFVKNPIASTSLNGAAPVSA